jgi:RNA polymerase primary sigma factor
LISWKDITMSSDHVRTFDLASAALLSRPEVELLTPDQERSLLLELSECKTRLLAADVPVSRDAEKTDGQRADYRPDAAEPAGEMIQDVVRELLKPSASGNPVLRHLVPTAMRYNELRTRLAMANLRLVAHVARRYRNRGLATSDLIQEGFCGLLKAIDRFDPAKETRLASYAVWWIRQALQREVAAGAYPVRLNPRHLQQLANSNLGDESRRNPERKLRSRGSETTIRQIYSATRPTISLNSSLRADEGESLLDALTYPAAEESHGPDLDDYLFSMINQLKPREQVVLQLRFGLCGTERHSLSQVSDLLDVSKERIRQIQEAALEKLRVLASGKEQLRAEARA